jgi:hypothetical protein
MKRVVKIRLNRRDYRKLLVCAKSSGFNDIQGFIADTARRLPFKICNHSLYIAYWNMLSRCLNPRNPDFKDYGGRGILIHDRWMGHLGFEHFVEDVPPRPDQKTTGGKAALTLNRKDNDGHYSPDNVTWSTWSEQAKNRRLPRRKRKLQK